MHRTIRSRLISLLFMSSLVVLLAGCTSVRDYVHNGFKVGPNYNTVAAPVACKWIDSADVRIRNEAHDISQWWTVFNDPVLNNLIACAYRQNLTVKQAAYRVLESRAKLAIARGSFFPQTQSMSGSYSRSGSTAHGFSNTWDSRVQFVVGDGFLGPLAQGNRIRGRSTWHVGRRLRRRDGHAVKRCRRKLCANTH